MTAAVVGIDFGTSGCRAVAVDDGGAILGEARAALPAPLRAATTSEQAPALWWDALLAVLSELARRVPPATVRALAVDGTSGTLLLTDAGGQALGPALMYDDARAREEAARIATVAPRESAAHGTGSALAKLLWLQRRGATGTARHAVHQADWIAGRLAGRPGISDENNCLKLGYDPVARCWPDWLARLEVDPRLLPDVLRPGETIGHLTAPEVLALGYPPDLRIVAGTTDSVAAFIATGAHEIGDAVTSLGSTIVLKVLSPAPVFAPEYGVYSHPLGGLWLAGGGSNAGGAVLLRHFPLAQIESMSESVDPGQPTGLDYYPLNAPGERFPVNDPALPPRLVPRPARDVEFFQGMLEGMARIEAEGYRHLAELGAPWPRRILSAGGGARNTAWTEIRRRALGVTLGAPRSDQACYGAAMLAAGHVRFTQFNNNPA